MGSVSLRALWREGRGAFGGWCSIPSSFSTEIVASLGFDYVCIDLQHGLADFHDLVPMLQAVAIHGPTPIVRVPLADLATAQRALDAGAEGVIFPMIDSADDARSAVAACRYPPLGTRSYGPVRSGLHLGSDPMIVNREVVCIAMIETLGGIHDLEAILSTPGVDAIYVGPADVALAIGVPVGGPDPTLDATIERILKAAQAQGIPAGIHASSGPMARRYVERGFAFATISTEAVVLTTAYRDQLAAARGGETSEQAAGIYG